MHSFVKKKTLRKKLAIATAFCFIVLWVACSYVLFSEFKKALWTSFDDQMNTHASIVVDRTSITPRIVPLPQKDEVYRIVYTDYYGETDTLFTPPPSLAIQLDKQRSILLEEERDNGTVSVYYSIPSTDVDNAIQHVFVIIIIVLVAGIFLSLLIGYSLSGRIVNPLNQVVELANKTNLTSDIHLLKEPDNDDEIHQLIVSFNRMLSRIKEQLSRQNAFFASASHELRTPLSVMQTRLQILLKNGSLGEDVRTFCSEQLDEVKKLAKMVNDFLLMSELQNGTIKLRKTACNLPDMLTDILSKYKDRMHLRGLQCKLSFAPEEELYEIEADMDKLQIIVENCLANSIKYAEENSLIEIKLSKKETISLSITNEIRNDIHPDISIIKKQFYHSKPLAGEGFGLGLWICNQLADLQHFSFEPTINGNLFIVHLTFAPQIID